VRVRLQTFKLHDELEGYRPLDDKRGLFVTSSRKNNLVVGEVKDIEPSESAPGR
jgi:hypothetical protein